LNTLGACTGVLCFGVIKFWVYQLAQWRPICTGFATSGFGLIFVYSGLSHLFVAFLKQNFGCFFLSMFYDTWVMTDVEQAANYFSFSTVATIYRF
jgi:hypothetical protein